MYVLFKIVFFSLCQLSKDFSVSIDSATNELNPNVRTEHSQFSSSASSSSASTSSLSAHSTNSSQCKDKASINATNLGDNNCDKSSPSKKSVRQGKRRAYRTTAPPQQPLVQEEKKGQAFETPCNVSERQPLKFTAV